MTLCTRPTITNDTGTFIDGTPMDATFMGKPYDQIDAQCHSTDNPTQTPAETTDEVIEARDSFDTLADRLDAIEDDLIPGAIGLQVDGVAGEALTANDVIYLSLGDGGTTPGLWYKADSDSTSKSIGATIVGIVTATVLSGADIAIILYGRVTGFTGLTAGTDYFIGPTAGGITSTAPTNTKYLGRADTTTSLLFTQYALGLAQNGRAGIVSSIDQVFGGQKLFEFNSAGTGAPAQVEVAFNSHQAANVVGQSFSDITATQNATNTETVLTSHQLPANTFNTTGRAVVIESVILSANAVAHTLRFFIGSEQVGADHAMNAVADATTLRATIMRSDATHVKVLLECHNNNGGDNADNSVQTETVTVDPNAAITWSVRGQATNTGDMTHYLTREYVA